MWRSGYVTRLDPRAILHVFICWTLPWFLRYTHRDHRMIDWYRQILFVHTHTCIRTAVSISGSPCSGWAVPAELLVDVSVPCQTGNGEAHNHNACYNCSTIYRICVIECLHNFVTQRVECVWRFNCASVTLCGWIKSARCAFNLIQGDIESHLVDLWRK